MPRAESDECGGENDQREGHGQEEDRDERGPGDRPLHIVLERASGDAQQRLDHDGEHGRLDADEHRLDQGQLAECRVQHRQGEHDKRARDHEQQPRRQPALEPVQPPADIGGELHGLGTRQQHAEVERVEVAPLVDPFALLHQLAVHERDLSCRSAEGQQADACPHLERFGVGRRPGRSGNHGVVLHVAPLMPGFWPTASCAFPQSHRGTTGRRRRTAPARRRAAARSSRYMRE